MSPKRKHFCFLIAAASMCFFVCADLYLLPSKQSKETIREAYSFSSTRGYYNKSYIITDKNKYLLEQYLYNALNIGDTVIIGRSLFTNVIKTLTWSRNETTFTVTINLMHVASLPILIFLIGLGTIVFMIIYDKVEYGPAHADLTGFLFVLSLIFFVVYLGT